MATKLPSICSTTFLLLALIFYQCDATLGGGVATVTRKGYASTIAYPISHSKLRRNGGAMTMDAVRHLEGEEENIHVHATKPFFSALLAIFIVNGITLVALLSLIPTLMSTRWNYFKSAFWVATTYAHTPTEINKQCINVGRSDIKNEIDTNKRTSTLLADIFVPSFVCGTILATTLFLVIPEAVLLIQRGTSSEEGEIEILSGTISRFGAAVMVGYMLPLALGALFPRAPEYFNTNSTSDRCESSSDLPVAGASYSLFSFINRSRSRNVQNENSRSSDLPVTGARYGLFPFTNRSRSHNTQNENSGSLGIHMREHHQEKPNEEEKHEESPRTILGSNIRMPVSVPMPAVFERLSQTETVSFFHQKWKKFIPVRKQREPTSAKVSQGEQFIDNNSEIHDDDTIESKTDNTLTLTSNTNTNEQESKIKSLSTQSSNADEESAFENKVTNPSYNRSISGELMINDDVEINELDPKERSTFDSKSIEPVSDDLMINDDVEINELDPKERSTFDSKSIKPVSDTSTGEDSNAKVEIEEYYKIDFSLATSIFLGDIMHNFFDGIFIGVSFKTCSHAAAVFVVMITVYKEISHEIAGYFLLTKHAGISIPRAVLLIFTSDLAVIVGALLILSINQGELAVGIFLAIASGVYLHISASECQSRVYSVVKGSRDRWFSVLFFVSGAVPVGLTLLSHGHCNE